MIKPTNYENIQTGDFVPPALGGHHMIIKQVREQETRTGKPMLVILVDFAESDVQPLYFSKLFASDIRPEKKWPNAGVIYVVSVDSNGQCSRNFKAFITSFEKSNNCEVKWSDKTGDMEFASQFAGKKIGGVYGRVEDEYNGERRMRTLLRYFCRDDQVDSARVPADKLLPDAPVTSVPAPAIPQPTFTQVNTSELPW